MNRARIVSAVTAVLGAIGLGLTMLPLISIGISERILAVLGDEEFLMYLMVGESRSMTDYWDRACQLNSEYCDAASGVQIDVTGYDVIASGYTAVALIPIVLALAVAAGALHAWRGRDSRVFPFLSLASASALFVLLFTWMNPSAAMAGSGEFAELASSTTGDTGSEMTLSVGAGLYLPAAALTVMFVLTTWQALESSNLAARPRSKRFQMQTPTARLG